jgi:hypothetical protein
MWAENSLFIIGKEITGWQKSQNLDSLRDAELGAQALLAITQELIKRADYA